MTDTEPSLTAAQRRTLAAREALDRKLADPETRSDFYRRLAQRQAELRRGRTWLSDEETEALLAAYQILGRAAARARRRLAAASSPSGEEGSGDE